MVSRTNRPTWTDHTWWPQVLTVTTLVSCRAPAVEWTLRAGSCFNAFPEPEITQLSKQEVLETAYIKLADISALPAFAIVTDYLQDRVPWWHGWQEQL